MGTDDLKQLAALLGLADAVVPVREGNTDPRVITLRHDVDDRGWDSMLDMAQWERRHGYRSTYYILHTAPYWRRGDFSWKLQQLVALGHEVGLHHNCLAEWLSTGVDPFLRLVLVRDELHRAAGVPITGLCAHGDERCYEGGFSNYQMFSELSDEKVVRGLTWRAPPEIAPRPAADFGFKYHAELQPRKLYLSDSGGQWHESLGIVDAAAKFALGLGPLTILQHPDWWPRELYG